MQKSLDFGLKGGEIMVVELLHLMLLTTILGMFAGIVSGVVWHHIFNPKESKKATLKFNLAEYSYEELCCIEEALINGLEAYEDGHEDGYYIPYKDAQYYQDLIKNIDKIEKILTERNKISS